jgi:hypothetical protein
MRRQPVERARGAGKRAAPQRTRKSDAEAGTRVEPVAEPASPTAAISRLDATKTTAEPVTTDRAMPMAAIATNTRAESAVPIAEDRARWDRRERARLRRDQRRGERAQRRRSRQERAQQRRAEAAMHSPLTVAVRMDPMNVAGGGTHAEAPVRAASLPVRAVSPPVLGTSLPASAGGAPAGPASRSSGSKRVRWTRDAIIHELAGWMVTGTAIDSSFLKRHGPPGLVPAAVRVFGRFDAALNVAGLHAAELYPDQAAAVRRSKRGQALAAERSREIAAREAPAPSRPSRKRSSRRPTRS